MKSKKFVFVLMPFDDKFNDIYTLGIKQTCTDLNMYCERVDEQIFNERILDRIYNQISKADIIVADMSNRNANVFYEVGYAHGLGRNVILLTTNSEDIPFDFKHFPHIIYNGKITLLKELLKTKLEWFSNEETLKQILNFDFSLEFLINGNKIEEGKEILISEDLKEKSYFDEHYMIKIDIFNSSTKVHDSKFKIGIETGLQFRDFFIGVESIKPSTEDILFVFKELNNLYPGAYHSVDFKLKSPISDNGELMKIPVKLKAFTKLELRVINFHLLVPTSKDFMGSYFRG